MNSIEFHIPSEPSWTNLGIPRLRITLGSGHNGHNLTHRLQGVGQENGGCISISGQLRGEGDLLGTNVRSQDCHGFPLHRHGIQGESMEHIITLEHPNAGCV